MRYVVIGATAFPVHGYARATALKHLRNQLARRPLRRDMSLTRRAGATEVRAAHKRTSELGMALRRRFLMFGVLAVAAVGCASQRGTALDRALTPDSSVIMPPTTIEDLLLVPDAVVVARITGIAGSFEYTFPTAVGEATAAPGEPSWALTDLFTDYDADVLDALLPYGDAINEATITIRTLGDKPSAWRVDQDYLLFLMESSGEPPGDVFDVVGAWLGAFPLGGETTVYVGGEPVPYAVGLEPAEFVEQVRDAITD